MPYDLRQFILEQMNQRDMSARQFADLVGVSNNTISRFVDQTERDPGNPSAEFLLKLAKATNTNPITVFGLAYPELQAGAKEVTGQDFDTILLIERFNKLPPHLQDAIRTIILQTVEGREPKQVVNS